MKALHLHLKKILRKNKEDLLYLLFVGIPTGLLMVLINDCLDYSKLF